MMFASCISQSRPDSIQTGAELMECSCALSASICSSSSVIRSLGVRKSLSFRGLFRTSHDSAAGVQINPRRIPSPKSSFAPLPR